MYCNQCGGKLLGSEKYCPNCGKLLDANKTITIDSNNEGTRSASIILGILSLVGVFIFIFAPVSLILAIIGLILAIKANKVYKNTAGIIINTISLFLSFIITSIIALIVVFSYDIIKNDLNIFNNFDIYNYNHEYKQSNSDKF